jgi:hypothetical protein
MFWFMTRDTFMGLHDYLPVDPHQILRDKKMLIQRRVKWSEVLDGSLAKNTASVSHRWLKQDHFDDKGSKIRKLKAILRNMPDIEFIWLDFLCAPQGCIERTEEEYAEFKYIIKNIIPFVYLGTRVIVLYDREYNQRFWPLMETWSAMQMPTPNGLTPATPELLRVCFFGMYSMEGEDKSIHHMLMANFHNKWAQEVADILIEDDIKVTNQSDKAGCLKVVVSLDDKVRSKFQLSERQQKNYIEDAANDTDNISL